MKKALRILLSLTLALLFLLGAALAEKTMTLNAADYPVEKNGSYLTKEEVAVYLATYGKLPSNFLTKNQAEDKGWYSGGDLWDSAPGCAIGGNRFGNYEGLLPDGKWTECDVDYFGGHRGADRIIFGSNGSEIYYTADHYNTFTKIIVDFSAPAAEPAQEAVDLSTISEYDEFTTKDEVAAYLHLFGHLPCNYLTKDEAKELGWSSKKDNLAEVMPGCAIGGDKFGNREKMLPDGVWYECDVNTQDGRRSDERLCYSESGLIFYTPDNHKTFVQLY